MIALLVFFFLRPFSTAFMSYDPASSHTNTCVLGDSTQLVNSSENCVARRDTYYKQIMHRAYTNSITDDVNTDVIYVIAVSMCVT